MPTLLSVGSTIKGMCSWRAELCAQTVTLE